LICCCQSSNNNINNNINNKKPTTMTMTKLLLIAPLLRIVVLSQAVLAFCPLPLLSQKQRSSPRSHGRSSDAVASVAASVSAASRTALQVTYLPIEVVDSMPDWLPARDSLSNHYYLLRHGQSTSNVEGIISSDRRLAYSETHGLTPTGQAQGRDAADALLDLLAQQQHQHQQQQPSSKEEEDSQQQVVFISSPFARARQTAQTCLEGMQQSSKNIARLAELGILVSDEIILQDQLVERNFGRLDGQELFTYAYVWPLDKFNVTHTAFDAESVAAVCTRIRRCILELEETYSDAHLVLVSHADVLQITQLYAAGAPNVGEFSSYRFVNGEVRHMTVGSMDGLPEPSPLPPPKRGAFIP
jgi:broad specificity phosphatase PhoE